MAVSGWPHNAWRRLAPVALLWAGVAAVNPSIPMTYCAKINTATTNANNSIYQSDGLCHDFCFNTAALAIVKGSSCWCSDYVPGKSTQVSTDNCLDPCSGYPDDVCGGNGLFGYMALKLPPSGTVTSGSVASSTDVSSSQTSPVMSTVTADGTVKTVTITPTAGAGSSNSADMTGTKKSLSTGAAVGVAVGVVGVIVAAAAVIFMLFVRRKRKRQAEEQGEFDAPSQRGGSSSGMMGTPKTEISEHRYVGGSDGRNMAENWEHSTQGKRRSTLMPIDPRMDPFTKGIYHHRPENKSHESVNSLQDNQDYSRRVHEPARVLRATNPDPDVD